MKPGDARAALRRARRVAGWFSPEAAELFGLVDAVQREQEIRGELFEIGVHHGRSAVVLAAMARPGERLGVCDLFGAQDGNVSISGRGDRDVFEANMRALAPSFDRLDVHQAASQALTPERVGGAVRLFHVDGGHLSEEAHGDLALAASVAAPGGVIVLDDPFRTAWPGVTEGALRFLDEQADWRPLLAGFNKLLFVRVAEAEPYERRIADGALWERVPHDVYETKRLPFGGHEMTVVFVPSARQHEGSEILIARALRARDGLRRRASLLRRRG